MVGIGLKKLAEAYGMTVSNGVAYGCIQGYAAAMCEGAGYKQIVLSTLFEAQSKQDALRELVSQQDLSKEYRVENISFAANGISIVFLDNPGTMKKIEAFLEWFMPLLEGYGAQKAEICVECGMPIQSGKWILRNGVVACYLHDACADKVIRETEAGNEQRKEADTGSYGMGFLGAMLGALVGSIAWAILYALNFIASIAGFAIGWLANWLYDKFNGKKGKGKIAILIVAVIVGVLLGTFLGDSISLGISIVNGELSDFALTDIPMLIVTLLVIDGSYRTSTLLNILLGLVFAGMGVFTLLRNASRETADDKVIVLK